MRTSERPPGLSPAEIITYGPSVAVNQLEPINRFVELAAINVNEHIDKKGGLSYLSWAWAVDQLLRRDPDAGWEYPDHRMYGETMMVYCAVTAFGKRKMAHLPVMDYKNRAIVQPDAFQVNTAMQRCLVKAIALHGIGLYIYAGEDLPEGAEKPDKDDDKPDTPLSGPIPANAEGHELFAHLSADAQTVVKDHVLELTDMVRRGDLASALSLINDNYASQEDQLILASQMPSEPRNKIKAYRRSAPQLNGSK